MFLGPASVKAFIVSFFNGFVGRIRRHPVIWLCAIFSSYVLYYFALVFVLERFPEHQFLIIQIALWVFAFWSVLTVTAVYLYLRRYR